MSEIRNPHGGYIEVNNVFPFRTEKLNAPEPMVLQKDVGELVTAKGVCKVSVWTIKGTGTLS